MLGWSPLGGGLLTGKYRRGEEGRATNFGRLIHTEDDPRKTATVDAVIAVAAELGVTAGQVARAWMGTRGVLPILGPRTRAQLDDNLGSLNVNLRAEHVSRLNEASAVSLGFPHEMLAADALRKRLSGGLSESVAAPTIPVA